MFNLFSADSQQAGFRLDYMEVYNWGTFHDNIYRISPQGNTSLLTGSNGSGKTTWIDALLTLLVPEKRYRFYNQSSGTDKKGDRDEESYVLGSFGDIKEEGKYSPTVQQLRPDKKTVYSIIIAYFKNSAYDPVTLFQARWFMGSELKRVYGIARIPLAIEHDFRPFDPKGEWKRALQKKYQRGGKPLVEFIDGPQRYAEQLVGLFGMRSTKALLLFNQTVGIKVLGNLDEFIRSHMLEYHDTEDDFWKLYSHFETLMEAHRNIEKAEQKITLLKPIKVIAGELDGFREQHAKWLELYDTAAFWFAERKISLIKKAVIDEQSRLQRIENDIQGNQKVLEGLRQQEREIALEIERDQVGQAIKNIEKEIRGKEAEKKRRKDKCDSYNHLVRQLQRNDDPDNSMFYETFALLENMEEQTKGEIQKIDDNIYQIKKTLDAYKAKFDSGNNELERLRQQSNNITGRVAEIREDILRHIGAHKDAIPFIGELIQIKPEEKAWESAIERLLHNFALRLLVPETYYEQVNQYVHSTNLQGRIIYHKVHKQDEIDGFVSNSKKSLLHKLEFHPKSVYSAWVEHAIRTEYDYLCADDLGEFQKYKKAITSTGLIKSSERHEKDDREKVLNRDNYVLGWDTKEKIKWWQQELKLIHQEIEKTNLALKQEENAKKAKEEINKLINQLRSYKLYEEIDWKSIVTELQALYENKKRLEQTNNKVQELQRQQAELNERIALLEKEREKQIAEKTRIETNLLELIKAQKKENEFLQLKEGFKIDVHEKYAAFEEELAAYLVDIDLKNIDEQRSNTFQYINDYIQKMRAEITQKDKILLGLLKDFKQPAETITARYKDWTSETYKLPDDTKYVDEYLRLLEKLERDDLPFYKKKFEDFLSTKMIHKIGEFRTTLQDWLEDIEESIASLNQALQRINFKNNPETYIQLKSESRTNDNVNIFRSMIAMALPDIGAWSLNENLANKEAHFREKIVPFIHKLAEHEEWRKEVIDVRNWESFYAAEFYRETNKPMQEYREMGKLSGGEKAQLTYTILGSALAYQFGITAQGRESRSFRFIAVDESFSNQDDEKATYLMDLCKQLHLQLLVVTPSDKIHIVEPYISFVHYVQRHHNRESILYDMPILQFQQERNKLFIERAENS